MQTKIPVLDFSAIYAGFDEPVCDVDCGVLCASHNPGGKPFCCDICQAVPALYHPEWQYLHAATTLWRSWQGDECGQSADEIAEIRESTPSSMQLAACKGPAYCERNFRSLSCRQFPFFPYITDDYRFIGLAYVWDFEAVCWVISHLTQVRSAYRTAFIATFDTLFNQWPQEMDSYAALSAEMREAFITRRRRIPILHRNGKDYLLSPINERLQRADLERVMIKSIYSKS